MQATSSDTSIEKRTAGRIDQWHALPAFLADSPSWGVGPGGGRAASVQYARKNISFHSLYFRISAERGLAGLTLLAVMLTNVFRKGKKHFAAHGEIVPLLGAFFFVALGVSVAGLETIGGVLIGVGFIAGNRSNLWTVRNLWLVLSPRDDKQPDLLNAQRASEVA